MAPETFSHALSIVGVGWMAAQLLTNGACIEVHDWKVRIRFGKYDVEVTLTRRDQPPSD
jgi:hypothetical protein